MSDTEENIVEIRNVSKTFRLPHERHTSIKSALLSFYRKRKSYEEQKVLKDISFKIKRGEFFGIVGRNGSGKSTLLKLLAGIYMPGAGKILVNGSLTPFIELGVGFNPELTGRENVFLNGALLGFNRKEMTAMYDDIVSFAELERFMDQKLKNYSSGMQVRLAFSIAIRANSDILLIDEVLAVGDAAFQQKCFDIFSELKKKKTTIILVTHDMDAVLRFCDRAMLIDKGKVVLGGSPRSVADEYLELNYEKPEAEKQQQKDTTLPQITSVRTLNAKKAPEHKFGQNQGAIIEIAFSNKKREALHFGVQIFNDAGVYCFGTNTKIAGLEPTTKQKGIISIKLTLTLGPGNYSLSIAAMNENVAHVFDYKTKIANFRMQKDTELQGVTILPHSWDQG